MQFEFWTKFYEFGFSDSGDFEAFEIDREEYVAQLNGGGEYHLYNIPLDGVDYHIICWSLDLNGLEYEQALALLKFAVRGE